MIDWLAGMTDRYAIRVFTDLSVPQGVLSVALYHARTRSTACKTRWTWWSWSPSDRPAAGRHAAGPGCARSTTSARPRSRSNAEREALLLLRLRRGGRRVQVRAGDGGARLPGGRGAAGRALRRRAGARGGGSARPSARRERRDRLHALLERRRAFYARVPVGRREAEAAREYLAERGLAEEVLREFRVGLLAERVGPGAAWRAQRAASAREELVARGPRAARPRGQGSTTAFRGRIMFPLADARGRVLGFGARAMREGRGPKYLNTLRERALPQGSPALRDRRGAEARRDEDRSVCRRRGLHRCACATSGRDAARPWRSWARR